MDPTALVKGHHAEIWRYLRYLGADAALADDLTQETFLCLLERPFEERSGPATRAYLRRIARNLLLKARKAQAKPGQAESFAEAERAWEASEAAERGAERRLALKGCLELLAPRARQALDLQYTERRPGKAIAALIGVSHTNLRVLLHRAKQSLRACLESKLKGSP